jgi:hypothetical protein
VTKFYFVIFASLLFFFLREQKNLQLNYTGEISLIKNIHTNFTRLIGELKNEIDAIKSKNSHVSFF